MQPGRRRRSRHDGVRRDGGQVPPHRHQRRRGPDGQGEPGQPAGLGRHQHQGPVPGERQRCRERDGDRPMSRLRLRSKDSPPEASLSERDTRLVWRIAALLIDYPGAATLAMLFDLRAAAAAIPWPAGAALVSFVDHARSISEMELSAHYVETFDLRKRSCLHLTYYAHGDTRKRGTALLRFKHAYRNAGVELGEHELPDHLSVVLEFAATADPVTGRRLLGEHRRALHLVLL